MQNQHILKQADREMEVVLYCTGELPDSSPYWAYIKVQPSKISHLGAAAEKGVDFDIQQYGEVIDYGFEEHAPQKIREKMTIEHGVNHNFADQLRSLIHKQ